MSEVFDLDAAVGEQIGEPFRFTWGGQPFSAAPLSDRDIEIQLRLIDVIESLDEIGKDPKALLDVLVLIVGADLLAEMRKARPVGGKALVTLIQAWTAHEGGALGKSPASPASSGSTAKPSKRTSRSTLARRTN